MTLEARGEREGFKPRVVTAIPLSELAFRLQPRPYADLFIDVDGEARSRTSDAVDLTAAQTGVLTEVVQTTRESGLTIFEPSPTQVRVATANGKLYDYFNSLDNNEDKRRVISGFGPVLWHRLGEEAFEVAIERWRSFVNDPRRYIRPYTQEELDAMPRASEEERERVIGALVNHGPHVSDEYIRRLVGGA